MIQPTVGRVVWYHPTHQDPGVPPGDQPLAAIVTHVWHDRLVNLHVMTAEGLSFAKNSVALAQDDESVELGMCQWMPYQVGQAKKHEAPTVSAAPAFDAEGTCREIISRFGSLVDNHSLLADKVDGVAGYIEQMKSQLETLAAPKGKAKAEMSAPTE